MNDHLRELAAQGSAAYGRVVEQRDEARDELARYKAAVSAVIDKPLTPHPKYRARRGAGGSQEVDLFYGKNIGFNEAANLLRHYLDLPIQPLPTPDKE